MRRRRLQQLEDGLAQQEASDRDRTAEVASGIQLSSSQEDESSSSERSERTSREESELNDENDLNPRQPVELRSVGNGTGTHESHGLASLFEQLRRERRDRDNQAPRGVGRYFQGDTESEDQELSDYLTSEDFNAIQKIEWGSEQARNFDVDSACKICYYPFVFQEEVCVVPVCHHLMHSRCLETWTKRNRSCPECHEPIFI